VGQKKFFLGGANVHLRGQNILHIKKQIAIQKISREMARFFASPSSHIIGPVSMAKNAME